MSSTPGFNTGDIPTAAQWNGYFGAKQDNSLLNYAALRANTIAETDIYVRGFATVADGGEGWFIYQPSDVTSADNGGTILVDASGRRFYRAFSGEINTVWFGAYGDNAHDDTTAIQNSINAALAAGVSLYTPPGVYQTTAQLNVGANSGPITHNGFTWRGGGIGIGITGPYEGTTIVYQGTSGSPITAICSVNIGAGYYTKISDMSFYGRYSRSAQYGLLQNSTQFSQRRFENIGVGVQPGNDPYGPVVAYGILVGTGANGEFTVYNRCVAGNVDGFFYCNAGQAFQPIFTGCVGSPNAGGYFFKFDATGIGATILGFSGSAAQVSGVSNTQFIVDNGLTSTLKVLGGRVEHVTTLYNGAGSQLTTVSFESIDFNCDFDPTNGSLTRPNAITGFGGSMLTFEGCSFLGSNVKNTFPIAAAGAVANYRLYFKRCLWANYARPPYFTGLASNASETITFEQCLFSANGTFNPVGNMIPVDRNYRVLNFASAARSIDGDTPWLLAGKQDQQLLNPQIANSTGNTVTPASGWTASSPGTIKIDDWSNSVGLAPGTSSSPFARKFLLAAGQTLSQTITSVDLSSAAIARYQSGTAFSALTWQMMLNGVQSDSPYSTSLVLTLSESASGTVIDSTQIQAAGTSNNPYVVTLSAAVNQYSSATYPVVTFSNTGGGDVYVDINWQYFSTYIKPSFAPVTTPATYTNPTAGATDSLAVWDRFIPPYKSDAYGSAATRALPNLVTDMYISSTDGRRTRYLPQGAGGTGAWGKDPNTFYASGVPTSGTWNQGDIVYNTAPTLGTAWSWECYASGTPGSWAAQGTLGITTTATDYETPTNGATVTLSARTTILDPAADLASLTLVMPATPFNEQVVTVSCTHNIAALTITLGGASMKNPATFMQADLPFSYRYRASNTTWYTT